MNKKVIVFLTITIFISEARTSRISDITEELNISKGSVLSSCKNHKESLLAVTTSLNTIVYKVDPENTGNLQKVKTLVHKFEFDGKEIQGQPLSCVIQGKTLVVNVNGVDAQAYDLDLEKDEPIWKWKSDIGNVGRVAEVPGKEYMLISTHNLLFKVDSKSGKNLGKLELESIKQIIAFESENAVVLTYTGLFRVSTEGEMMIKNQKEIRGGVKLFRLDGLKSQENKEIMALNYLGSGAKLEILEAESFTVLNSLNNLHGFYQLNSLEIIKGTDSAVTSGGDRNILLVNILEKSKAGYPIVIHREVKDFNPYTVNIFNGVFGYTYQKSSMGEAYLRFAGACPIKNCLSCQGMGITVCEKCEPYMKWNAEESVCKFE